MKLNLGCGSKRIEGCVNVDKFATATTDLVFDLERTPWPWDDSSVDEMRFIHSLEHMGADTDTFLAIVKEIWRIGRDGAKVEIHVPHPRHDNFLGDPTHVRPITPQALSLFDRQLNEQWIAGGTSAATPLGVYLGIDLHVANVVTVLDPAWWPAYERGELPPDVLERMVRERNNVIAEFHITWQVRKS
jgi:hypothetical protein